VFVQQSLQPKLSQGRRRYGSVW